MCNGFHFRRESLKMKAFYIHFSSHPSCATLLVEKALHDFLTLRFLPRMFNDPLEIDGSTIPIRSDKPAFLTLHRVVSLSSGNGELTEYASRDHVKASEGVRFEIYNGDAKVLKGVIRKDEQGNWKLDCKRGLDIDGVDYAEEAHVEVAIEVDDGHVEFLNDKVKMRRRVRRNQTRRVISGLEEIPEEGEEELESCCCDCDCDCDCDCGGTTKEEMKMDGEDCEMEMDMENVSWAVDAAILVVSLGVGYLVSRASSKKLIFRHWR